MRLSQPAAVLMVGCCLLLAPARAEELEISRSLAQYFVLVDLSAPGGRIVASSEHGNRRTSSTSTNHSTKRTERLSIATSASGAALHYSNSMPARTWTIEFRDDTVTIERTPQQAGDIASLAFRQPAKGDLELRVGEKTVHGRTLWHLMIQYPDLCQRELVPVLQQFNDDWSLVATARQIEGALLFLAETTQGQHKIPVDALIADLGARTFATRRAAERRLRALGTRVLPRLESLDMDDLSAEQRVRVRRLIDASRSRSEESPATIARRLAADREIWLAMLERPSLAARRAAAAQLAELLARPVDFTPDATRDVREQQINRLKQSLQDD